MKKYVLLFSALCFVFGLASQNNEIRIPLPEAGKKGKLNIEIKSGHITLKGTARQDVWIKYEARGSNKVKVEEGKNGLKKISGGIPGLEISSNGNNVKLNADNWQKAIDVTVEVPQSFDLELSTYNMGTIKVDNIKGEVVLESFNGPITANGISGSLVANTYNGAIKATFDQITPDVPMAFTTYVGEVDITLPSTAKASFKMKAESGDVYTDFDIQLEASEPRKTEEKRKNGSNILIDGWIYGKINGGGPEFRIENHFGDVYIREQ